MESFFKDIDINSIITIKKNNNKYCVVGKEKDNIYIRILLKNNDDIYRKNKKKNRYK